jgi:hypothetical protein
MWLLSKIYFLTLFIRTVFSSHIQSIRVGLNNIEPIIPTNNCTSFYFDSMNVNKNLVIDSINFTNYLIINTTYNGESYFVNFSLTSLNGVGNLTILDFYLSVHGSCNPIGSKYPNTVFVSTLYNDGQSALVSATDNLTYIIYESPFENNYGTYGLYFIFGVTVICPMQCYQYKYDCDCVETPVTSLLDCQNTTLYYPTSANSCIFNTNQYITMPIFPMLNGWVLNYNELLYQPETYVYFSYLNISFEYKTFCSFEIYFIDAGVKYNVAIEESEIVINQSSALTNYGQQGDFINSSTLFKRVMYGGSYYDYFVSFNKGYYTMYCNTSYSGYSTGSYVYNCYQACTWGCSNCFSSLTNGLVANQSSTTNGSNSGVNSTFGDNMNSSNSTTNNSGNETNVNNGYNNTNGSHCLTNEDSYESMKMTLNNHYVCPNTSGQNSDNGTHVSKSHSNIIIPQTYFFIIIFNVVCLSSISYVCGT